MTQNPTTIIETGLTLHTMHEAIDRLPDEITLHIVRAGDLIALRTSETGPDRVHARTVHHVGTGAVTFELTPVGDATPLALDLFERLLREIALPAE
jgi:hypothetical protein